MKEQEFTVDDNLEVPLFNRLLVPGISGSLRYLTIDWEDNGEKIDETEIDAIINANLRINHTKHLNTEWYMGGALYSRPDNKSDEYKDFFGGIRVNYVF